MRQWDRLSDVVDGTFVNGAGDCSISHGDGQNEVGLVNRSVIDGANGLTVLQLGLCFIGSNDIDEADVMVANDLSFTPRNGDFRGTTGRSTFVHEFGHLFGFLHEDVHAVLRTTPPHLITGGSEPSTVWPSDTIGMNSLYGFSTHPSESAAVGARSRGRLGADPRSRQHRHGVPRRSAAPRASIWGTRAMSASGTYNLRVRLSTTAPMAGYSLSTTVAASFTHSMGAFTQGTFDLAFTVPWGLANGTYFIYADMDHTGTITEILEGDNSTVSAKRIRVNC